MGRHRTAPRWLSCCRDLAAEKTAFPLAEHMAVACGHVVVSLAHKMGPAAVHGCSRHGVEQEDSSGRVEEEHDRIELALEAVGSGEEQDEADKGQVDSQGRGSRKDKVHNAREVCSQGLTANCLEDIQACSLEVREDMDKDARQVEPKSMVIRSLGHA